MKRHLTILCFVLYISLNVKSASNYNANTDTLVLTIENFQVSGSEIIYDQKPSPAIQFFKKKHKQSARIIAALLAFPFPFGIVGLHRIYLGTAPYVPVAYIASLGGVFGILPMIDFLAIIFTKNFDGFKNNQSVFMWIKKT